MKIPLLEYLDKLEATAKAAPQGEWSAPRGGWPASRYGEIISDELPHEEGYGGKLITESCNKLVAPHIVATQPRATLALIAKLREAIDLVRQGAAIAAFPGVGANAINRFQDDVVAWASIEVPE